VMGKASDTGWITSLTALESLKGRCSMRHAIGSEKYQF
jgi:hypothetical protein